MTLTNLLSEANKERRQQNNKKALELYEKIWEIDKNAWNGYFLAQCYRKESKYQEAHKIHSYLGEYFPGFKPIKNEKLWLAYDEKIKDWKNENLISDAEEILQQSSQSDKYSGRVYTKTVLRVIRNLLNNDEVYTAYQWFEKLDHNLIPTDIYVFKEQAYPSDRKTYFILLADTLIEMVKHEEYIEKYLNSLGFLHSKLKSFREYIIDNITFEEYISRTKLALYLKLINEEIDIRQKKNYVSAYNSSKTLLVSDLSHFTFCPASFAINETFEISGNTSWEKDEWYKEKKYLIDRHETYKSSGSYRDCFKDTEIREGEKVEADFGEIFKSKIIEVNINKNNASVYSDSGNTLKGSPDYLFEHPDGHRFIVTEKFSKIDSADYVNAPYKSDLIKHYAYLDKFESLNLSYGIFVTWYWEFIDIGDSNGNPKKKMKISKYRLVKVQSSTSNADYLNRVISEINKFKSLKKFEVEGDRISKPSKCLNCSVMSYCNHKTGSFNTIELPYKISKLQMKFEPKIHINDDEDPGMSNDDDLPF